MVASGPPRPTWKQSRDKKRELNRQRPGRHMPRLERKGGGRKGDGRGRGALGKLTGEQRAKMKA
eukprot:9302190-Lingulodinium_polyedra.AAC.1